MSDEPQQFQPTPSFLEHDRPSVRLVELPAWLQAFAASVGEPVDGPPLGPVEAEMDAGKLSTPAPAPQQESAVESSPAGSFGTNFISEDDLPDWLRSIAPEESDDVTSDSFHLGGGENTDQLAVPNVTRAWSTSKDARGVDESTSLFALVASQASQSVLPATDAGTPGSRPQVGERSAANARAETTGMVASYGSELPPDMAAGQARAQTKAGASDTGAQPVRVKLPVLPVAVAGILLLVLLAVAVALFVL